MARNLAQKGETELLIRSAVGHTGCECLIWPYGKSDKGYGLATVSGVQATASRHICILAHGEPPADRPHAAHSCGNPPCFNPNHLSWKSIAGNMADKLVHGTNNHGERNGKTFITEDDVIFIRGAPLDLKALADMFGMSKHSICKIRMGKTWKYAGGKISSRKPKGSASHCGYGHPFDDTNTYWTKGGYRVCRQCGADKAYEKRTGVSRRVKWSAPHEL